MSLATAAVQQANALAAAKTAASQVTAATSNSSTSTSSSSSTGSSAISGNNALTALSSNFGDFLNMLMTQLQNQDPTDPLDTNQFTSELVQFSGVEQQINTNNSLTQLIQLTQSGEVMQGTTTAGKQVTVTSNEIPLQNGSGSVSFTATASQPVAISIYNSAGQDVRDAVITANAGSNTWTWNGEDNSGNQLADGAYKIAVVGANADGTTAALPFTVTGTATGVQSTSNGVQLDLGALPVSFSAVQSVNTTQSAGN